MLLKFLPAESVSGGAALVLCDDDGVPLGRQIAVRYDCQVGDMPTATVTFYVDGETLHSEVTG